MNRKDRAITDQTDCIQLLSRCDTLRLGLWDGTMPYVVPISFGMEVIDDQVILYFHGAARGKKVDCLTQHPQVCVEGDIFYKVEPTQMGITTRYESVIGFGTAQKVEGDEKIHSLKVMLERYHSADYPVERCRGLTHTAVYKITLDSLTGKRNLPEAD